MTKKKVKTKVNKGYQELSIDMLTTADWNYKRDDEETLAKLKNNIKRNGLIENLIVRELDTGFFEVVNGNHRLKALGGLGIKTAQVYNLGKITLQQAQRVAWETNETKFDGDPLKIGAVLKDILTEFSIDDLIDTTTLNKGEIENYIKLDEFDWDNYSNESGVEKGKPKDDKGDKEGWKTLKLELPDSVADLFMNQLERINAKVFMEPDKKYYVQAVETIAAHLQQMGDQTLKGSLIGQGG